MTLDPAVAWILVLALALLFATAAAHKLGGRARFRSVLVNYRLLPRALAPAAAIAVIGAELAAAALLVASPLRAIGVGLAVALLVAYALALALNLARGRTWIDCGCLGFGRHDHIAWSMVARNLVFAGLALLALLPPAPRELVALDVLTIGASVLCAAILYGTLTRLAATPSRTGGAS